MRLVSLVPSSTETLLALGGDVVACTRFCEQPGIATVGGTKNPDVAAIVALVPDLVVMDVEENRREDHDALVAAGVAVLATDVRSVADARKATMTLAAAAGVPTPEAWDLPAQVSPTRSAVVPIWRRPWMLLGEGTYGTSVLAHLGISVAAPSGKYPTVELDEIATEPDLVVVPSEPYSFAARHVAELAQRFPSSRVVEVDGQDLLWWGSRTPAALHRLETVLA